MRLHAFASCCASGYLRFARTKWTKRNNPNKQKVTNLNIYPHLLLYDWTFFLQNSKKDLVRLLMPRMHTPVIPRKSTPARGSASAATRTPRATPWPPWAAAPRASRRRAWHGSRRCWWSGYTIRLGPEWLGVGLKPEITWGQHWQQQVQVKEHSPSNPRTRLVETC